MTLAEFAKVALEEGLTEDAVISLWIAVPLKAVHQPLNESSLRRICQVHRAKLNEESQEMRDTIRRAQGVLNN